MQRFVVASVLMGSNDASDAVLGTVIWLVFAAVGFVLYWLPAVLALARKHHQLMPIVLVNFFFGWTGIGWIAALVWSVSAKAPQSHPAPHPAAQHR